MRMLPKFLPFAFVVSLALLGGALPCLAANYYVDNRLGDDAYDGLSQAPLEGRAGPFRTIRRAVRVLRPGDGLTLANNGFAYYESLPMEGPRFSGSPEFPFTVEGNGAVLSGARLVPPYAWQYVTDDVWRFRPFRKGYFQLMLNSKALPEVRTAVGATKRAELVAGEWTVYHGIIYYRSQVGPGQAAPDQPIEFAGDGCGIALINVRNVLIRNLTVQHFREDGVNAHDGARNVILRNVRLLKNGRAGLAVGGTSLVGISDSTVQGNREEQILNIEVAQTEVEHCVLDKHQPYRIRGGHVLIDGQEVFSKSLRLESPPGGPNPLLIKPVRPVE